MAIQKQKSPVEGNCTSGVNSGPRCYTYRMHNKLNAVLPLLAALIVLFSSMWEPGITLTVSVVCLIALSLYYFLKKTQ